MDGRMDGRTDGHMPSCNQAQFQAVSTETDESSEICPIGVVILKVLLHFYILILIFSDTF